MEVEDNFSSFTNLYEISKTLRFELKPVGETQNNLKLDWIIQKDREIEENYVLIKDLLDDLHILFVEKSLENVNLEFLDEFYNCYIEYKKDSKNKKNISNLEKITKNIRKELISFFVNEWNSWLQKYDFLKKWWIWFLTEKEVLKLLKELNPDKSEIIEKFDRFFTYFSNFNESRKNFYAEDGRAWSISTRAIDENLITFIENIEKFKNFYGENEDWVNNNFSKKEKEIFELDFYNICLLQKWIDNYNKIIWWYSEENWNKIAWINEKINLYKQDKNHNNSKDKKFPKFDLLYKQILSKVDKKDFIIAIEDNKELFEVLEKSKKISLEKVKKFDNLFTEFFDKNINYNLENIYISKVWINTISNKFFENWDSFKLYLGENKKDFINFSQIKIALEKVEEKSIFKEKYYKDNIAFKEKNNYKNFLNIFRFELKINISEINKKLWNSEELNVENFKKWKKQINYIKNFMDSIMDFYKMIKYFNIVKNKKKVEQYEKDGNFYNEYDNNFIDFEIWKDYNLVRNYLSKKDIKTDKFKLNFDNSQFLIGWDKDKEKERYWVILKKDQKYFLWILKKWFHVIFSDYEYQNEEEYYEKMEYKQNPWASKMFPKCSTQLKDVKKHFQSSSEDYILNSKSFISPLIITKKIFDLNNIKYDKNDITKLDEKNWIKKFQKEYLKISWDENWFKESLNLWINFCKDFSQKYKTWQSFDFSNIKKSIDYNSLDEFYLDIEKASYNLDFRKISSNFIKEQVEEWNFYLFQIYNKDFSPFKKSWTNENIHTKYFKLLFDEQNLENLKIKLSWWAEIFFRDKTKNLKQRVRKVKDSQWQNEEKIFYKDKNWEKQKVLEHRRYADDKILFHISVTLNANAWDKYKFNSFINERFINKNKDVKIIWIDRWEKHLAYYSVIDKDWQIIETDTLNVIKSKDWKKTDYLKLLEQKQKSRADWRLSWWEIENIKELKNWYISQVVYKLVELIIEHNAIIVFEDLNSWFKRWRQKIEKQIYQKLELALAKKLNYLTFKDRKNNEIWWYLNWIQLVWKVNDYSDIWNYKQSGIVFYTNPAYTSTTCPICGWRKTLKFPRNLSKQSILNFFENIEINFDWEKFSFTYSYFNKKKKWNIEKEFIVYSNVKRIKYDRKRMENFEVDINEKLLELFNEFDLNWNINNQLQEKELPVDNFLKPLFYCFKDINQIRNSDSNSNKDIISCPSCLYNSDDWFQWKEFNWDANWAYNIARKWLIILENIDVNPDKPNLFISESDWDNFLNKSK